MPLPQGLYTQWLWMLQQVIPHQTVATNPWGKDSSRRTFWQGEGASYATGASCTADQGKPWQAIHVCSRQRANRNRSRQLLPQKKHHKHTSQIHAMRDTYRAAHIKRQPADWAALHTCLHAHTHRRDTPCCCCCGLTAYSLCSPTSTTACMMMQHTKYRRSCRPPPKGTYSSSSSNQGMPYIHQGSFSVRPRLSRKTARPQSSSMYTPGQQQQQQQPHSSSTSGGENGATGEPLYTTTRATLHRYHARHHVDKFVMMLAPHVLEQAPSPFKDAPDHLTPTRSPHSPTIARAVQLPTASV